MQLLFYLVYYHSTCFGHGSCPPSGVIHKTVKAATSVCQCVGGEVVLSLVVICKCNNDLVKIVCVVGYCRVIINQVKQRLHLIGYLLIQYFKDARYHEHKKLLSLLSPWPVSTMALKENMHDLCSWGFVQ